MPEGHSPSASAVPRRALIIRPSALGDVCRSVGVLAALRQAWPSPAEGGVTEIDWLVQDTFTDAIRHHPGLTRIVPFPRNRLGAWWRSPPATAELASFLRGLRAARYDVVLDCQGLARSGLFAWMTRAPRRIGYSDAQESSHLAMTERVSAPISLHTVDRMMLLAEAAIGGAAVAPPPARAAPDLRLYSGAEDREWLNAQAWSGGRFAVLAPTSRWPGKRWPADRFAAAAGALLDGRVERVVVVGGQSERDQCGPLLAMAEGAPARLIDLVGRTSVGRLMAVIERASLVVANDSAALHMAVGFDRPLVGLFGPTHVDLVGPYGRERDVVQVVAPGDVLDHKNEAAGRALMERIRVEDVLAAADGAAARAPGLTPAARG